MTNTLTFTCTICGEPSTAICAYCTKDACANHLCERCGRCSDCCECEVRLEEHVERAPNGAHASAVDAAATERRIEAGPMLEQRQQEVNGEPPRAPAPAETEPADGPQSKEPPAAGLDATPAQDPREHQE